MLNLADPDTIKDTLLAGAGEIISTRNLEPYPAARADDSFRADRHLHREILFILEGESRFMLNGRICPARPGTAFLLDRWENHSYGYRREDRNLIHLWIHSNEDRLYGSLIEVGCAGQYHSAGSHMTFSPDLHHLLLRRWEMLEKMPRCSPEAALILMKPPVDLLLNEFALLQFGLIDFPEENTSDIMVFLRNYIRNANGRGCSLENLERLCGYSRFHLSRLFREQCGQTIGDYIDEVRLHFTEEARKRGLKQKEIAAELGFSSPSAFWYWHRKHQG